MTYADRLKAFENVENLGGKAWEHAVICDLLEANPIIQDCTPHCTNYQQMLEMLIKHGLETKSVIGSYRKTHDLVQLLNDLNAYSRFSASMETYQISLNAIKTCAEAYRYDFQLNCKAYWMAVEITKPLIDELLEFLS